MAAQVRPARVTDAPFLARTMNAAARGHTGRGAWDLYLDDDEPAVLRLLERLATGPEPSFSLWSGFLVAEVDGTPAAALCGYSASDPRMRDPDPAIDAAWRDLGWTPESRKAAEERLAPFVTCLDTHAEDAWVVEWVATERAQRGQGLSGQLLEAILDIGRRRGHRRAELTVFIGNASAISVYRRAGFATSSERRHPAFATAVGCPGLLRMTRDL